MKTLYPAIQKFSLLLLAVIITGVVNAQNSDVATRSKTNASYAVNHARLIGPAVNIGSRSERKIQLRWAPLSGAVSHYILERSFDGRKYNEAGVFFTGEWLEEPEYVYTDKFRSAYSGPLYYRLRIVGLDGTEVYTSASISEGQRQ